MFSTFFNYLMSFNATPSVTDEIADVLAGFTGMADRLDDAIMQGEAEIDASTDRVETAFQQYLETRDAEIDEQDRINEALVKAETARDNIRALVGEA